MIIKLFVTLFLMITQNISLIGDTPKLTFDRLSEELASQEVEIRGFFYESKQGTYILASQPNLKSCCVGSKKKIDQQIVLLGDLPEIPVQRAVTVQGYFVSDPTYNEDDELIGLYYLKNIKLLSDFDDASIYSFFAFLVIITVMVVGVILYKRNK